MTRRGGKVELSGVGLGVSATSLFGGGFHVDASAQATRFDVDMTSGLGRRLKESDGSGWALGLEAGRSMTLNSGLSVMPNLGLVWSQASMDTFTDANGSRVSMDDAESLVGRLGVAAVAETDGGPRLFGSVDVTHEFSEETEAMVSGDAAGGVGGDDGRAPRDRRPVRPGERRVASRLGGLHVGGRRQQRLWRRLGRDDELLIGCRELPIRCCAGILHPPGATAGCGSAPCARGRHPAHRFTGRLRI